MKIKISSTSGLNSKNISVLIAEAYPVVVEGLLKVLSSFKNIAIAGIAVSGNECLTLIGEEDIDVIMLGTNLADVDIISIFDIIRERNQDMKVIITGTKGEKYIIRQLIDKNVEGCILKTAQPDEIITAVKEVTSGRKYISDDVKKIIRKLPARSKIISRREEDVLLLMAQGYTNNEIAGKLFISPLTVDTHRKNLVIKLNARNTASLIWIATKMNLV